MNYFISFLLLFLSTSAWAQLDMQRPEILLLSKKDSLGINSYNYLIGVQGDYSFNSNSITNSFVNALGYKRIFIDDHYKDNESARLKKSNRFGVDTYAGIVGEVSFKKSKLLLGFGQRYFASGKFPADLFEVIFRGNAMFAGESANFSKTAFRYFDYQNFSLGLKKEIRNGNTTIGGSLSLLLGGNHQQLTMNSMTMDTELTGQSITLNGDMEYIRTNKNTAKKNNGTGFGLNLFLSNRIKQNILNIEVRDLGYISWKNRTRYIGDGSYSYNGYIVNDILSSDVNVESLFSLDSIASMVGFTQSDENYTTYLPTTFHINYIINPNKRFSRTIGIKQVFTTGYIPKIYLREADFLGKGFTLTNTFSYGGFGRFDYEIGIMKKVKNNLIINANFYAFEFLVLPKKSSGNGLNLALITLF